MMTTEGSRRSHPKLLRARKLQFKNKKKIIFVLGRFIPRKGVEIAVEVTRRLGKRPGWQGRS